MIDRMRFKPDRLYLTAEAADRSGTVEGFTRRVLNVGKDKPACMILTLSVGSYDILRIICRRLDSGRWQVTLLDINLPALLRGHNACGIHSHQDYSLALSRVQYFVSLVTESSGHCRILPSLIYNNHTFIHKAEAMIQILDPEHRILIGSHLCSKPYQHRSHLVGWGESTSIRGEDLAFSFYDKATQRKCGKLLPKGNDGTRIECLVKNPERLAREAAQTGLYIGEPGEVVRTLSMDTSYDIIRNNVSKLTGFAQLTQAGDRKGNKVADCLFIGLGNRVHEPYALELALENYRRLHRPCQRTFSEVSKALRTLAVSSVTDQSSLLLPEHHRHLQWSDIQIPAAEHEFASLCRTLQAPDTPDPLILEAWATTTFLKSKPTSLDLAGDNLLPFQAPWRTSTL